jgi:hypothetical protein
MSQADTDEGLRATTIIGDRHPHTAGLIASQYVGARVATVIFEQGTPASASSSRSV